MAGLTKERLKAIHILEKIAELMGDETMFDGEKWFELEDAIVEILKEERRKR